MLLSRRQKIEVLPPAPSVAKNRPTLRTSAGIIKEMGKTYRCVANGTLPSEEGTRRVFMLERMRVAIEAQPVAGQGSQSAGRTVINILPVLSGRYVHPEDDPQDPRHLVDEEEASALYSLDQEPPPPPLPVIGPPALRVIDNDDEPDSEPPAAA